MRERRTLSRMVGWFATGLIAAALIAEGSAQIAEAMGPPVLRWYDASTQLKVEQMDRLTGIDVVFAGTSMVWQGFVPDAFTSADASGRTAYNAGLAGGVPVVMEPWLLEEVIPRLQPDVVIWGLSSMDFSTSYGSENLERYRDALSSRTGIFAAVEHFTSRFSALVRYRTVLRRPAALFGSERADIEVSFDSASAILGNDGERLSFEADLGEDRGAQVESRFRDYRIDENDIEAIFRTIKSLEAHGVTVVLVEMPVPERYVELHPEGAIDVARAHEAILAIGDLLDHRVIDLRFGYSDDDFVDYTHLGPDAAADLSTRLAASLAANDGTAPRELVGSEPTPLIETTRRAYATIESLYHPLTGGGPILKIPDHWYGRFGYLHEWNAAWHQEIGTEFDVVFVGSSMMLNAADPRSFTEKDLIRKGNRARPGRFAYNAALPSSYPEDQRLWLESFVLDAFSPSLVVWGLAPRDVQAFDNRPDGGCLAPTAVWDAMQRARARAFEPVPDLADVPWRDLYFGETLTGDADPLARAEMSTLGDRIDYGSGPVIEELPLPEATLARFSLVLQEASPALDDEPANEAAFRICQERLALITDTVGWLKTQGIDVLVIGMPMGDRQALHLPDGWTSVAEANEQIEQAVMAGGAIGFLDLSDALPNRRFTGGAIHLDYEGSIRFTKLVVRGLRRAER